MEGRVNKFSFLIFLLGSVNIALGQIPPPPPGEDAPILSATQYLEYVALLAVFFGLYLLHHYKKKENPLEH